MFIFGQTEIRLYLCGQITTYYDRMTEGDVNSNNEYYLAAIHDYHIVYPPEYIADCVV